MKNNVIIWGLVTIFGLSCSSPASLNQHEVPKKWASSLQELSDEEYPDNPDIGLSHSKVHEVKLDSIRFEFQGDYHFKLTMLTEDLKDSIIFSKLSLMELMPTLQERFKRNDYLAYIALVNQEWNRNQIRFSPEFFTSSTRKLEPITRIDIARNCLNTYLWEVIAYAQEEGKDKVYYHGWFNFPKTLFKQLFWARNHVKFDLYASAMEHWIDPENKKVWLGNLRQSLNEKELGFTSHNDQEYLKIGERNKKFKNIIYPKNTTRIKDFLTDSTLFATFSPPGFYNTKDPRKTYLSRLANPGQMIVRNTTQEVAPGDTLLEISIRYNLQDSAKYTELILSGIRRAEIPVLRPQEVHKGWQSSMGFGNHTFYETYEHSQVCSSLNSPYIAFLLDKNGNWLDSHKIGIDGPLLYFDHADRQLLHVLILSFERHAIVGHYSVNLQGVNL